jgi:hypothetical protein
MTAEEWALAASVFFSGLAAAFLVGLCRVRGALDGLLGGDPQSG